jgi:hypothetical protein
MQTGKYSLKALHPRRRLVRAGGKMCRLAYSSAPGGKAVAGGGMALEPFIHRHPRVLNSGWHTGC